MQVTANRRRRPLTLQRIALLTNQTKPNTLGADAMDTPLRPTPKTELAVRLRDTLDTVGIARIEIIAITQDAQTWTEREAPAYGTLMRAFTVANRYTLSVHTDIWDVDEVIAYLQSYAS